MQVLVLTQHFAPEVTAGSFRLAPIVEELTSRAHRVEVITEVPNHPRGVIDPEYRGRVRIRRRVGEAAVDYVWVYARPRKTLASRLGFYGSFAAMATAVGAARSRPDAILASSPPLPVGLAGAALGARHRTPWVLDVRDVWPDAAVDLGELSAGPALAAAQRLERRLYRSAAAIVTVNEAFRSQIAERAPAGARVELIPNGTTRSWLEVGDLAPERSALGDVADRFVWAYAGNIGLAHGLETAVEAAKLLGDGYALLIIGDGPRRERIAHLAEAAPSGAVELRPLAPPSEVGRTLRAADALLVSERQERTVASKLYDYGAVGRPIVAACRGELRRVVESSGAAIPVEHGDPAALADAIRSLRERPDEGEALIGRGRELARSNLREAHAARMADLLEQIGRGGLPDSPAR